MNFDNSYFTAKQTRKMVSAQRWINRVLYRMGMRAVVKPMFSHQLNMVSELQKINFFFMLNEVLSKQIPGDVVELGCFEGQSAVLLNNILQKNNSDKKLFLFDRFDQQLGLKDPILNLLKSKFDHPSINQPIIVEGDIYNTIPRQLPESISFIHIDLGSGGNREQHTKLITFALENTYYRMPPGAVCLLMDYYIEGVTVEGYDSNPGVKDACDQFFKDKPETVYTLPGGEFSHGYFRKK
ncbi:MAG TPA: TylF/MycF/NovP-related O-methyltransferase [Bacteroidia bacterium]|nr:TylF/MycF/NovP-related O-methyltransferase [Bacteroidia bacterium]